MKKYIIIMSTIALLLTFLVKSFTEEFAFSITFSQEFIANLSYKKNVWDYTFISLVGLLVIFTRETIEVFQVVIVAIIFFLIFFLVGNFTYVRLVTFGYYEIDNLVMKIYVALLIMIMIVKFIDGLMGEPFLSNGHSYLNDFWLSIHMVAILLLYIFIFIKCGVALASVSIIVLLFLEIKLMRISNYVGRNLSKK